jgi:hypothetical protein
MEHAFSPSGCVHALPGRLRVKVAAIKRAPTVAREVEQALRQQRGIAEAIANPVTGSVLIRYDAETTSPQTILARLASYGVANSLDPIPNPLTDLSNQLSKVVGKELMKLALTQMLPVGPVEVLFALI